MISPLLLSTYVPLHPTILLENNFLDIAPDAWMKTTGKDLADLQGLRLTDECEGRIDRYIDALVWLYENETLGKWSFISYYTASGRMLPDFSWPLATFVIFDLVKAIDFHFKPEPFKKFRFAFETDETLLLFKLTL